MKNSVELKRRLNILKCAITFLYGRNSIEKVKIVNGTTFDVVLQRDLNTIITFRVYKKEPEGWGSEVVKIDDYYVWREYYKTEIGLDIAALERMRNR